MIDIRFEFRFTLTLTRANPADQIEGEGRSSRTQCALTVLLDTW